MPPDASWNGAVSLPLSAVVTVGSANPAGRRLESWLPRLPAESGQRMELCIVQDLGSELSAHECALLEAAPVARMVIFKSQEKLGPGGARNLGLELTSGDFVCFIDDDDDPYIPGFLQVTSEARANGADMAIAGAEVVGDPHGWYRQAIPSWSGMLTHDLSARVIDECLGDLPGIWRMAFSRAFLQSSQLRFPSIRYGEDTLLLLDIREAQPTIYSSQILVYRHHIGRSDGLSRTRNDRDVQNLLKRLLIVSQQARMDGTRDAALSWRARVFLRNLRLVGLGAACSYAFENWRSESVYWRNALVVRGSQAVTIRFLRQKASRLIGRMHPIAPKRRGSQV